MRASSPLFERVFDRARLDLHLLRSSLDGDDYFAAGVPWFATLFGRDSATVAIQTLPYGSVVGRDTLRLLARYQARAVDAYRDAEPGKILHEYRMGELARLGAVPQSPAYYGTVDATPLFLILLSEYVRWSGDLALARELAPNVEAALGWMAHAIDDGDGYIVYRGRYPNGLVNQGWKDPATRSSGGPRRCACASSAISGTRRSAATCSRARRAAGRPPSWRRTRGKCSGAASRRRSGPPAWRRG